jgi:hypothetical protein
MRTILRASLVILLAAPMAAQKASTLDDPIPGEIRIDSPRSLHPCAGAQAVDQIARAAHMLVGFENAQGCWLAPRSRWAHPDGDKLTGLSPRLALDHVIAAMSSHLWRTVNGIIVVRPTTAWADPDDFLNQPVQPFEATNALVDEILHTALRAATPSVLLPHEDVPRHGALVSHSMTVQFSGGSMLDALNAIVGAHGSAEWEVGYSGNLAYVKVSTLAFPKDSVMAPAALPKPHR